MLLLLLVVVVIVVVVVVVRKKVIHLIIHSLMRYDPTVRRTLLGTNK